MAYTKVVETALTGGKSFYTSEILTSKFTELTNSGDLIMINETLPNGNKKATQTWRDETTFNSFISWLSSSGEGARMAAYHAANNITPIIS